jgi:hypothetical protein
MSEEKPRYAQLAGGLADRLPATATHAVVVEGVNRNTAGVLQLALLINDMNELVSPALDKHSEILKNIHLTLVEHGKALDILNARTEPSSGPAPAIKKSAHKKAHKN